MCVPPPSIDKQLQSWCFDSEIRQWDSDAQPTCRIYDRSNRGNLRTQFQWSLPGWFSWDEQMNDHEESKSCLNLHPTGSYLILDCRVWKIIMQIKIALINHSHMLSVKRWNIEKIKIYINKIACLSVCYSAKNFLTAECTIVKFCMQVHVNTGRTLS